MARAVPARSGLASRSKCVIPKTNKNPLPLPPPLAIKIRSAGGFFITVDYFTGLITQAADQIPKQPEARHPSRTLSQIICVCFIIGGIFISFRD